MSMFRLVPYDYDDGDQLGAASAWRLDLISDAEAGVTSLTVDSSIEKRFTSYKYVMEGRNPMTGSGGDKVPDVKEVRAKDRKKENIDLQVQGWFDGENAKDYISQIDFYARMPNLALLLVTDQVKFCKAGGGYGTDMMIHDMNTSADFAAGLYPGGISGGNVALDELYLVQPTGSIRYTQTTPTAGSTYALRYNPAATFNLNSSIIHFWMRASRDHDMWDYVRFYVVDGSANVGYWEIGGASAGTAHQPFYGSTWTEIVLHSNDMIEPGSPVNEGSLNYCDIRVTQKVADTTTFTLRWDYLEGYGGQWQALDIPFYSVEGVQTQKRGGRSDNRYDYTLRLKRIRNPPR